MFKNGLLNTIVLGIAIAVAGISMGVGFFKGRASDRYVTVKGLAEREVNADLAVWPITFKPRRRCTRTGATITTCARRRAWVARHCGPTAHWPEGRSDRSQSRW